MTMITALSGTISGECLFYKENGGLHTGYNKAIEMAESELCVCIDSDDYMPDDAIERIIDFWNKNKNEKGYSYERIFK